LDGDWDGVWSIQRGVWGILGFGFWGILGFFFPRLRFFFSVIPLRHLILKFNIIPVIVVFDLFKREQRTAEMLIGWA
jgi:hypothetical protein